MKKSRTPSKSDFMCLYVCRGNMEDMKWVLGDFFLFVASSWDVIQRYKAGREDLSSFRRFYVQRSATASRKLISLLWIENHNMQNPSFYIPISGIAFKKLCRRFFRRKNPLIPKLSIKVKLRILDISKSYAKHRSWSPFVSRDRNE